MEKSKFFELCNIDTPFVRDNLNRFATGHMFRNTIFFFQSYTYVYFKYPYPSSHPQTDDAEYLSNCFFSFLFFFCRRRPMSIYVGNSFFFAIHFFFFFANRFLKRVCGDLKETRFRNMNATRSLSVWFWYAILYLPMYLNNTAITRRFVLQSYVDQLL